MIEKKIWKERTLNFQFQNQETIWGSFKVLNSISFKDEGSFLKYFEDCFLIRNKIKQGFYAASSIEDIFSENNSNFIK